MKLSELKFKSQALYTQLRALGLSHAMAMAAIVEFVAKITRNELEASEELQD